MSDPLAYIPGSFRFLTRPELELLGVWERAVKRWGLGPGDEKFAKYLKYKEKNP